MSLKLKNNFITKLPGDLEIENSRRQVLNACYSLVKPRKPSKPELIHISPELADTLGLEKEYLKSTEFVNIFSGNKIVEGLKPYAMCYGGHQFGSWAGQLGDGRAINLGEIENNGKSWILQLKGAGETPYSRSADGLAVLRSSIREYLCSEAMHHLGVSTTRALSLVLSGDEVLRDVMYNGNAEYEKGAVVCRVSPSFLRFGNYEIFAARQDIETLKTLVNYTIKHHFAHLGKPSKDIYIQFFKEVMERTLHMIINWQRVGFVHGVMNTDNMSILGLTIDFGPYGWLEGFDFGWTPNTTDSQHKRYRFGNQPNIGLWNLYQLANALYPIIEESQPLEDILNRYKTDFETKSLQMMRSKLGLELELEDDAILVQELEDALHLSETDMTIFFRSLSNFEKNYPEKGLNVVEDAFYRPDEISDKVRQTWMSWFSKYGERLQKESKTDKDRKLQMDTINPKYVLRNYMAQLAIDAADKGDYSVIAELFDLLKLPYSEQFGNEKWFAKRPEWARHKIGCSMLSCSS